MSHEMIRFNERAKNGENWITTTASLLVGFAFFFLWFWLLPRWLGFQIGVTGLLPWRWIAAVPSMLGFAAALRCVWDFGKTGHGTPAPIAPPRIAKTTKSLTMAVRIMSSPRAKCSLPARGRPKTDPSEWRWRSWPRAPGRSSPRPRGA